MAIQMEWAFLMEMFLKIWSTFKDIPLYLFLPNDWKITVSTIYLIFTLLGIPMKFLVISHI